MLFVMGCNLAIGSRMSLHFFEPRYSILPSSAQIDNSWDNGEYNGNYYSIHWGYIGIMENKMETTIVYIGVILG